MDWIDRLDRRFGRHAIPHLMYFITGIMLAIYVADLVLGGQIIPMLTFSRSLILQGEVWRVATFLFLPPNSSPIWILFSLYFYCVIGNGLEGAWGSFRFNVFYLVGALAAILSGFLTGASVNEYLNLSLFLAFAALYPEHQVLLFFFIPIKIKYLAYLDWILFAWSFIVGSWTIRAAIVASLINFFLFFGPGMFRGLKNKFKYRSVQRNWRKQMKQNGGMR